MLIFKEKILTCPYCPYRHHILGYQQQSGVALLLVLLFQLLKFQSWLSFSRHLQNDINLLNSQVKSFCIFLHLIDLNSLYNDQEIGLEFSTFDSSPVSDICWQRRIFFNICYSYRVKRLVCRHRSRKNLNKYWLVS